MSNEPQLRASNNDGMNPYWKPEPSLEDKIVRSFKDIFYKLKEISYRFNKYSDEDLAQLEKDDMVIKVIFTPSQIRELRKILKDAR